MTDIILISPSNDKLGVFYKFVPRSVPLGIGILAGYLRKFDMKAQIADEEVLVLDDDYLREKIKEMNGNPIFGISAMTTNIAKSYQIAKRIKAIDSNAFVLMGGIHPTVAPEEVLRSPDVDFLIKGEGEDPLLDLVREIKKGFSQNSASPREALDYEALKEISRIAFKMPDGEVFQNTAKYQPFDVNLLPAFPYDLFDSDNYDLGFILTSRGCPFNCIFCSQKAITRRRYRARANDEVIRELEYLILEKGQKNITFFDDFFTGDKKRVFELCKMVRERGLHEKCSFGVQTRGDSLNPEILEEMKRSGFDSIMIGFEVSSNELMKTIKKGETVEDNIKAIILGKEHGFSVEATFIFGFPKEGYDDRIRALQIAKDTKVDRARFNIATPYPGTELYEIALAEGRLHIENGWNNFSSVGVVTAGIFSRYKAPYCPEGVSRLDLAGQVFLANLLFYLNTSRLARLFNSKKSGSGKWFELPKEKIFNVVIWFNLMSLAVNTLSKLVFFLVASKECRRFFIDGFFSKKKSMVEETVF